MKMEEAALTTNDNHSTAHTYFAVSMKTPSNARRRSGPL
jgi:hypothetical protein